MLYHLLDLPVALPGAAALIFGGAYLWTPASTVTINASGTTVIDIIPTKLRFWRALGLTGNVMMITGSAALVVSLLCRLAK